jgi:glycosyltransferase involved in cell wall biosynthesis
VIATRVAGVSELVEDGVTGRLVPPGNLEHLTAAIREMASDPDARRRMGREGRKTVEREFDAKREAARIATLFQGDPDGPVRPEPASPV